MADRVALPPTTKKVYEVQWAQRTRKRPKTGFPEPEIPTGRSAVWRGNGCQRFLSRRWAQNKVGRAREGGLSGIPANFVFEIWTNLGDFGHKKGEI